MWRRDQILGLIGGIITIIVSIVLPALASVALVNRVSGMTPAAMGGLAFALGGFAIIGIVAGILGIVGSRVGNKVAAGVLMIVGAVLSLPIVLGAFGVGFILMLIGGILALASKAEPVERYERRTETTQQPTTAPPPPPPNP